jgi:phosphohistidine phosphatase
VQVFLVRHADAVDASTAQHDAERHLTASGRAAARALGDRLRWYDCRPTALWTSPLVRAVQTIEQIAEALGWSDVVESVPALAPRGDLDALYRRLAAVPLDGAIVMVGHEPDLGRLGARIIGRELPALRRAEAARIDGTSLRWVFSADDEAPRPASALA